MFTKEILYLKCRKFETLEYKDKRTKKHNSYNSTVKQREEQNK